MIKRYNNIRLVYFTYTVILADRQTDRQTDIYFATAPEAK